MKPNFPGMDPYLEHPALWPNVHVRLANAIGEQLGSRVDDRYWVGMERRVYIEYEDSSPAHFIVPDLTISGTGSGTSRVPSPSRAVESPVVLEVPEPAPVEVREVFLVIRELPAKKVVTVLKILSPGNKRAGHGRQEYLGKRNEVLRTRTNLVELDLLRAGDRLPVRGDLPISHYLAFVHRGERRPKVEVYPWGLRDPFPMIPVPLLPADDDVELDLGGAWRVAYERGRYERVADYTAPAEPELTSEEAAWTGALRP